MNAQPIATEFSRILRGWMTPEEWAQMVAHRVITISDRAPEPIRSQAQAFRDHLIRTVGHYVTLAMRNEREACASLADASNPEIAQAIRSR